MHMKKQLLVPQGDQYAIVEALQALDSQIDFSQYDVNNDGYIDSVIFVYSKAYDYDVDPWWAWVFSGQYGVASSIGKLDGKTFDYYMWASYEFIYDTIPGYNNLHVNSETFVHELGHLMGFPDLYSYEGDYEFGPLGGFDMMDYNVGDHGPLNKLLFGWLQPLVAKEGTYQVTLDLSSYTWHQGGQISVSISVTTTITNDAENVTLNITVS